MLFSLDEKCALLPGLSGRTILHGAPWLDGTFLSRPVSREHFDWWRARQPVTLARITPDDALAGAAVHGDLHIARILAETLARVPRPVADYAIEHASFVAAGISTLAFVGPWPARKPWLVVLSACAGDDEATLQRHIAHELAHLWTLPEPSCGDCAWTVRQQHVAHRGREMFGPELSRREQVGLAQYQAQYARNEWLADYLADQWGF